MVREGLNVRALTELLLVHATFESPDATTHSQPPVVDRERLVDIVQGYSQRLRVCAGLQDWPEFLAAVASLTFAVANEGVFSERSAAQRSAVETALTILNDQQFRPRAFRSIRDFAAASWWLVWPVRKIRISERWLLFRRIWMNEPEEVYGLVRRLLERLIRVGTPEQVRWTLGVLFDQPSSSR